MKPLVLFFVVLTCFVHCRTKYRSVEINTRSIQVEGQQFNAPPIRVSHFLKDTVFNKTSLENPKAKVTFVVRDSIVYVTPKCPDQEIIVVEVEKKAEKDQSGLTFLLICIVVVAFIFIFAYTFK